jgi:hypothetical protein
MSATHELIANYLRSWNETDPLRRRVLIEEVYAEHVTYTDPMTQARGWAGIEATIAAVQAMFPGHRFSLAGSVDAHHDLARFQWQLTAPGAAEALVIGFDVAELDDGRIRRVHGFLDRVPIAA